jgi:hypothetical protein
LRNLFLGILLFFVGQSLVWLQTNGQFVWPIIKKNPLPVSIIGGTIISYTFIVATKYLVEYYDGQLWPGRFIGFATGILAFSILTYFIMNEGMNIKTLVSLGLSVALILVQLFWK